MNYKHFFQKFSSVITTLLLCGALILPLFSLAAETRDLSGGIVPCDTCTLSDLVTLVDNVIYFVLFYLAAPLAVLSMAIGGLLMITARGDTGQLQRGKDIFYNTVIGFVVAFGAWLIVEAVITALVPESGTAFTKLKDYISL